MFSVEYEDGGQLREATFFERREADAFAAEQKPAGPPTASTEAVQRANQALFDRIRTDRPREPTTPRTLRDLLRNIRSGRQTTRSGVR